MTDEHSTGETTMSQDAESEDHERASAAPGTPPAGHDHQADVAEPTLQEPHVEPRPGEPSLEATSAPLAADPEPVLALQEGVYRPAAQDPAAAAATAAASVETASTNYDQEETVRSAPSDSGTVNDTPQTPSPMVVEPLPTAAQEAATHPVDPHIDQALSLGNGAAASAPVPHAGSQAQSPAPAAGGVASQQNAYRLPAEAARPEVRALKNGRVGTAYAEVIDLGGVSDLIINQPDLDIGIHFDRTASALVGTPVDAGDFEWTFSGVREGRPVSITARVAVIPDPRTLWKNLPSDPQAPFWKRDEQSSILDGEVFIVAASKRGRSHAHEGGFRDDHYAMTTAGPGGWHVVAVADGAGSAKYSRRGSEIAVEYVARNLPGQLATIVTPRLPELVTLAKDPSAASAHAVRTALYEAMVHVGFAAAQELEASARDAGHHPSDYSTTLIMSAVTRIPDGWFFTSFSVGDGGAALLDLDAANVLPMTTPDGGEFAGQTRFLRTSEFADPAKSMERLHFAHRPNFTALVLMTDGISDPKFATDANFSDYGLWQRFWEEDLTPAVPISRDKGAACGTSMLNWMDFWSDGNHDDRTLAVLVP